MASDGGVWVKLEDAGTPGAAVIDSAVADDPLYPVKTSSYTGDGTNGEDGQNYDVYEFLGSGTLNVTTPGFVDALVVGGGGGAHTGRTGGGGGGVRYGTFEITAAPYTVTVAGGGGSATSGGTSEIVGVLSAGGGERGHTAVGTMLLSGWGGGGGSGGKQGASTGSYFAGGGAGGAASGNTPGVGVSSSLTGTSVTYGAGGAGGTGGAGAIDGNGYLGGSGIVIVRVKVAEKSFGDRTRAVTPKTAHAARVENGVVKQVITIPHLNDDDNKITEYCNKIGLPGTWVDTSYTGARRGKYAGVGDLFDLNARNAEFTSPVEVTE